MSRISLKKDYVDGEILYGADLNINNEVTEKGVNDNQTQIDTLSRTKANLIDFNNLKSEVDLKADLEYVNQQLDSKVDGSTLNIALANKADKTELELKADKTELELKADKTELANKADKSALENKVDKETVGDLTDLQTKDKSSVVGAINEVNKLNQLPIASEDTLGAIKVGANLTIEEDGTLNAQAGGTGGGTTDYNNLENIPTLNGTKIKGTLTSNDLNLVDNDSLNTKLQTKQDKLTAGENIEIDGTTIKAIVDLSNVYNKTESDGRYIKNVAQTLTTEDLNDITTAGFYYFDKGVGHHPYGDNVRAVKTSGYLLVFPHLEGILAQLAVLESGTGLFYRTLQFSTPDTTWTDWINSSTSDLIGDLYYLKTDYRDDLVGAINEIYDRASYYKIIERSNDLDLNEYKEDSMRYDIGRAKDATVLNGPFEPNTYEGEGIILDVYSITTSRDTSNINGIVYQVLNTTTLSSDYEKMYRTVTKTTELDDIGGELRTVYGEFTAWQPLVNKASNFGDSLPIGTVIDWYGENIPNNFLELNGQAVSRTTYSELFEILGTKYGTGDGVRTFNLPNKSGRVAIGLDTGDETFNTLGKKGGSKTHIMTIDELVRHNHPIKYGSSSTGTQEAVVGSSSISNPSNETIVGEEGGNLPFDIMNPYIVSKSIIKAKNSIGYLKEEAEVIANLDSSSDKDALSASMGRELASRNPDLKILTSLSQIGLSGYTTLDDITNAIENNVIFIHYLSGTNATILYNEIGGKGNLPSKMAGLLIIKRLGNWYYVDYIVNGYDTYRCSKFTAWRDWQILTSANVTTGGDPVLTGRIIDGKPEYVKRYFVDIDQGSGSTALGLTVSKIEVTNLDGRILTGSGNYIPISYDGGGNIKIATSVAASSNTLKVTTNVSNFKEAKINVYYINK